MPELLVGRNSILITGLPSLKEIHVERKKRFLSLSQN